MYIFSLFLTFGAILGKNCFVKRAKHLQFRGLKVKIGMGTDFMATITRCNLSPRFFCIDATLLCEFESDKI